MSRGVLGFLCNCMGFPFRSLLANHEAIGFRAAFSTFTDLDFWYFQLRDCAENSSSLSAIASGRLHPPGWASISFVEHLISCRELRSVPETSTADVNSSVRKFERKCFRAKPWHNYSIQNIMYSHLVFFDPSEWRGIFAKRIATLCPEHRPPACRWPANTY